MFGHWFSTGRLRWTKPDIRIRIILDDEKVLEPFVALSHVEEIEMDHLISLGTMNCITEWSGNCVALT